MLVEFHYEDLSSGGPKTSKRGMVRAEHANQVWNHGVQSIARRIWANYAWELTWPRRIRISCSGVVREYKITLTMVPEFECLVLMDGNV